MDHCRIFYSAHRPLDIGVECLIISEIIKQNITAAIVYYLYTYRFIDFPGFLALHYIAW